ncbi:MAG: large-conductance mechanosensitive channel protein MscL [Pirellulaceae bacterium]|nr:large-conductance mechanosensitive channel protein MscL [Pirellulaceae bacterium]
MGMFKEFREFALRGNVVDMAVGVIIGGAFGKIVSSLVNDVLMPPLALAMRGADFSKFGKAIGTITKEVTVDGVTKQVSEDVMLKYGSFFQAVLDFTIIAICLFFVIKAMNMAKARFEEKKAEAPPEAPPDVKLLAEIRDLLKARG